jgi:hypothetical protein
MHLTITRKQLFKLVSFLVIGVMLIVGFLIVYNLNRASVDNELVALDLLPKPETFTELYFNDSAHLPASAKSNQSIRFSFVIHNLEAADYQYTYEVSVIAHGTRHVIDSGNVLVKNNQYSVKNEKLNLINSPGKQEVIVDLTNKRQSIDFWIGEG